MENSFKNFNGLVGEGTLALWVEATGIGAIRYQVDSLRNYKI